MSSAKVSKNQVNPMHQLIIPDHITIIDLEKVNCYLIETVKGFVLIDTGFTKNRLEIDDFLQTKGITSENQKLKLILLTHGDFDHTGNAKYLKEKYGAKIALHADDVGMVEYGDISWNRNMNVFLRILGKIMTVVLDVKLKKEDRFVPDIILENNQILVEYGLTAKIITLPGHSKGSVGVLTEDGHFFCGDILENLEKPEQTSLVSDKEAMEQSMEKIETLEFKYVYPGHGKPFEKQSTL